MVSLLLERLLQVLYRRRQPPVSLLRVASRSQVLELAEGGRPGFLEGLGILRHQARRRTVVSCLEGITGVD